MRSAIEERVSRTSGADRQAYRPPGRQASAPRQVRAAPPPCGPSRRSDSSTAPLSSLWGSLVDQLSSCTSPVGRTQPPMLMYPVAWHRPAGAAAGLGNEANLQPAVSLVCLRNSESPAKSRSGDEALSRPTRQRNLGSKQSQALRLRSRRSHALSISPSSPCVSLRPRFRGQGEIASLGFAAPHGRQGGAPVNPGPASKDAQCTLRLFTASQPPGAMEFRLRRAIEPPPAFVWGLRTATAAPPQFHGTNPSRAVPRYSRRRSGRNRRSASAPTAGPPREATGCIGQSLGQLGQLGLRARAISDHARGP